MILEDSFLPKEVIGVLYIKRDIDLFVDLIAFGDVGEDNKKPLKHTV